jgi:hypothetical protein
MYVAMLSSMAVCKEIGKTNRINQEEESSTIFRKSNGIKKREKHKKK